MSFNDNHKRHLLSSLAYVDGLLSEAEALLVRAETTALSPSPIRDLSPAQRQATADFIVHLRGQIRDGRWAPADAPGILARSGGYRRALSMTLGKTITWPIDKQSLSPSRTIASSLS